HRIEIILTNLLSNAIKYTPDGGHIIVNVNATSMGCEVEVFNSGEGIPAEDLPHVFERFYQVERKDRRKNSGAGIGLALAKQLVELHGGELLATSQPGLGTRFTMRLRAGRDHFKDEAVERRTSTVPAPSATAFGHEHPKRRRTDRDSLLPGAGLDSALGPIQSAAIATVLVVEDQHEIRSFVRELLQPDYNVLEAENGVDGFELAERERPDLILSDVMMPEGSGTELATAIKEHPQLRTTPIILLTARIGSEATLEAYSSGADDFISKPFHPEILLARVRAQLQIRQLGAQITSQEKFAAVGTLAAGIAHEIKNPVNAIISAAHALNTGTLPDATKQKLHQVILDASKRIDRIASALNTHARPAEHDRMVQANLVDDMDATLALLAHKMKEALVHRDFANEAWVMAHAGQIGQVFVNLIDNALRSGATELWIRVASSPRAVLVSVRDNGPGIPKEIVHRITDAFFTTRAPGEGTGLGLYISKDIVEKHGGRFEIDPGEGQGATFTITLPSLEAMEHPARAAEA
ncbi:MAG: ATP-binding protein, partial [Polyangiales bacterium]